MLGPYLSTDGGVTWTGDLPILIQRFGIRFPVELSQAVDMQVVHDGEEPGPQVVMPDEQTAFRPGTLQGVLH
jgi:hypothetical protein